jgi:hypothetical protein
MNDPRPANPAAVTPERGTPGVAGGPVVVFRPRAALLAGGPLLLLAGIALAVAVAPAGAAVAVVGAVVSLSWLPKVEVGNDVVRARGVVGTTVIPYGELREVGLRRVPFGPPRPPHRSYRIGRVSTTPIRLRIVGADEMIQLTAALWANWPTLVRVMLSLPGVQSDSRTRGRLDRYGTRKQDRLYRAG